MTDESSKLNYKASPKRASNLYSTKKFTSVDTNSKTATPSDEHDPHVYTNPVETTPSQKEPEEQMMDLPSDQSQTEGCYLLYDSNSAKLMLQYSNAAVRYVAARTADTSPVTA